MSRRQPRPQEEQPVNWARLRQLYARLTSRRQPVLDGLVLSGIVVEAGDPKELAIQTERVLVERVLSEDPS